MKKLLLAVLALVGLLVSQAAYPGAKTSLQWGVDRTTTPWQACVYDSTNTCQTVFSYPSSGGSPIVNSGYASVLNNTQLSAVSTATISYVSRQGFAAANDGGYAQYYAGGSACSLNAGAGDGGSQVPSLDGKCWLIDAVATPLNPYIFGAKGDGNPTHNDSPAFNAEAAAAVRLNTNLKFGKAPSVWIWNDPVVIDYKAYGGTNFQLEMDGADIDASGTSSDIPFQIRCGTTSGQDSSQCQGLQVNGMWRLNCNIADYCFQLGKADLSDVNQAVQIEYGIVTNQSKAAGAAGCQLNFPTTDNIKQLICNVLGGGGLNAHGPAKGVSIIGSSMNLFTVSGGAGECTFLGNCDTPSLSNLADAVGFADPIYATGQTGPPPHVSNVISGGDDEVSPVCLGVTASAFYANQAVSQFAACFQSYNTNYPTKYTVGGTVTAGDTLTVTATNTTGAPTVTVAAGAGDTLQTMAQKLANAVNASSSMKAGGVYAALSQDTVHNIYVVYLEASSSAIANGQVFWTNSVTGTETLTAASNLVGGNLINNPMLVGAPSWRIGNMKGWEISGQGATTLYHTPYGPSYVLRGSDANSTISSYYAGAIGPQVVAPSTVNATSGATSITITNAANVRVTDLISSIGLPCTAVVSNIVGNVVSFTGCTITPQTGQSAVYVGTPFSFTPPDAGTTGTTGTYTLPDCTTINGGKSWQPLTFTVENGNPITLNTTNTQVFALDNTTKTSLAINSNYDSVTVTCNGSYWLIVAASAKVLTDNGFGLSATWTPVLKFGSNTETATTSGRYTVSPSRQVIAEFQIALTAKVGTGVATVTGLPLAATGIGQVLCYYNAGMSTLTGAITGYVQSSTITFSTQGATATTGLTDANWTTTANQLNCTATYIE